MSVVTLSISRNSTTIRAQRSLSGTKPEEDLCITIYCAKPNSTVSYQTRTFVVKMLVLLQFTVLREMVNITTNSLPHTPPHPSHSPTPFTLLHTPAHPSPTHTPHTLPLPQECSHMTKTVTSSGSTPSRMSQSGNSCSSVSCWGWPSTTTSS